MRARGFRVGSSCAGEGRQVPRRLTRIGGRSTFAILASLCALVGVLALSAPALAADTHDYLFQFGEVPASSGALLSGPNTSNTSMTVDSGHVWIAEHVNGTSNYRVDKFDASSGKFISQFANSTEYLDVAVGHTAGESEPNVYLAEYPGAPFLGVYSESGTKLATWTGAGTPAKSWGYAIFDVAVDNSTSLSDWAAGDVYVPFADQKVVDVFKPEVGGKEKYVTQLTGVSPTEPFADPGRVSVDDVNGDVIVADGEKLDLFEPTVFGEYAFVRTLTIPGGHSDLGYRQIDANDGEGDIYVVASFIENKKETTAVFEFNIDGVFMGQLRPETVPGGAFGSQNQYLESVAADPATQGVFVGLDGGESPDPVDAFGPNLVIPDVTTAPVSNLKPESATLGGTVNPDKAGATSCQFAWGTSASYGNFAPCPGAIKEGESPVSVAAGLTGLQPDTTYHYRLQAANANGTNIGESWQDQEFTTTGPGTHGESASSVTSVSATLNAIIDPHGVSTTYYFQYGTSESYENDLPAAPGIDLGAEEGQNVDVHLQGLESGTTYHYRVVTVGDVGGETLTFDGPDQTFNTQAAGSEFTQPDGRAWEMVTPPNKYGAGVIAIGNEQGDEVQAATDGSRITYAGTSPFVENPPGSRATEVSQAISFRRAPGSWETSDITTANTGPPAELSLGAQAEYKVFSPDLSVGLVEPVGVTPFPPAPTAAERTIYLRRDNGEFNALVTPENVAPGVKFGAARFDLDFIAATPDLSHVILTSVIKLTEDVTEPDALYEWSGGVLQPASVLPGLSTNGGAKLAALGFKSENVRNAISNDGSRLVFEHENHLYLRDMTRGETVQIDAAQGAPEPANGKSLYETANGEDSRVFFTSGERLTASSGVAGNAEDLYEFEVTSGPGQALAGKLIDLTAVGGGRKAGVGGVIGASEDGSVVYFVAAAVLGDGAEHGAVSGVCRHEPQQACNLYVESYSEAAKEWLEPRFIAVLSGNDAPSFASDERKLTETTARVSPDGRYLAFMSERNLTGYENRDANSGVPDEEVFSYDAGAARLICASCDPTGARPVGQHEGGEYEERLVDYAQTWPGHWVAANIPGWTSNRLGAALYQSRYLSNNGRLFFNSEDALVPADVNGREDVYEYEPAGIGSCQPPSYGQSASDVFSESLHGCVALISAGTSTEESAFMDASETGGDAFFLTLSRLAPEDYDTSLDVYDAHECTSAAPCAPAPALVPPPCSTGDACKPGPTPQPALFGTPSSETFSGAGNITPEVTTPPKAKTKSLNSTQKLSKALKACKKKTKRVRAVCQRQARKKYGAKKAGVEKSLSARARR